MFKILFFVSILLSCAKTPEAPMHTPWTASLSASNCSGPGLALVGTDTNANTSTNLIVPVPLNQLTMTNLTVQSAVPFPSLPNFTLLAVSATVNDAMGGYIQVFVSPRNSSEKVPSNALRWIPLSAGTYKVSAYPCNSLGCRKDLEQIFPYLQVAANPATVQAIGPTFTQCYNILQKLQDAGTTIVEYAKGLETYFQSYGSGLHLADSCMTGALNSAAQSMQNIQTLGPSYMGEIASNADALHAENQQLLNLIANQQAVANASSNKVTTVSETTTTTATQTSSSHSSTAGKAVLLSLGVVGIVTGLIAAVTAGTVKTMGWTNVIGNLEVTVEKMSKKIIAANLSTAAFRKLMEELKLDSELKTKLENKVGTLSGSVEDIAKLQTELTPQSKMYANQKTLLNRASIGGIAGIAVSIAGAIAVGVSQLSLVGTNSVSSTSTQSKITSNTNTSTSTDTSTSKTNAGNPFDQASDYFTKVIFPLQQQFRDCTVSLYDKVLTAPK